MGRDERAAAQPWHPFYAHLSRALASDLRAAEAVALFCYQAKKWIGSFAALGGLDTLVFAGGIGENAPLIRERIGGGLGLGGGIAKAGSE